MTSGLSRDAADVRTFFASPRHAHHFATDRVVREVIRRRRDQLLDMGRLPGKIPIVSFQSKERIVELHDGNASVVAWLLYAEAAGVAPTLGELRRSFDRLVVLEDRRHPSGEIWHPFVPPEVACAARLRTAFDREQDRTVRMAVTHDGGPVLFNDETFFGGVDRSEPLGEIVDALRNQLMQDSDGAA